MENCPKCGSSSIYKSKKYGTWICEDCDEKFSESVETKKSGTPASLQMSFGFILWYQLPLFHYLFLTKQLYNYVEEGNIGCTLFLIRDVFELMIKLPVVILLMESIQSWNEKNNQTNF